MRPPHYRIQRWPHADFSNSPDSPGKEVERGLSLTRFSKNLRRGR
jgi:hypothetical protein